jgi:Ca2+-transporting ATPase
MYGGNRLADTGPTSLWSLLWDSIRSPMMLLLLSIAGISLILGQFPEAIVMAFVAATYVAVHLLNKARADRTMARLREVQAPRTRVLREGQISEILTRDVVVGDLLPLQAGTRVAADGRLVSAAGLLVDESALTGESAPVRKDAGAEPAAETPLVERRTAIFGGTTVLDGLGRALVVTVGQDTELGKVAELVAATGSEPTPLQQEMDNLARVLAFVAIAISLLIPLLGLLHGSGLEQMILTWLPRTFLMVPGQPPIIIAMALALASPELTRHDVIVRRLQGAETLGAVTVLLSDKIGTMTENRMVLNSVLLPDGRQLDVGPGANEESEGLAAFFGLALQAMPEHTTDPTDLAVVNAAQRVEGISDKEPSQLVHQRGLSRSNAYRAMEYRQSSDRRTFLAGRPDFLLERSTQHKTPEGVAGWSAEKRDSLKSRFQDLAATGQGIAAYAYREDGLEEGDPSDLVFVGAAVIADPIRPEVAGAVSRLESAGIRVLMVTGDTPEAAAHVGREVGFVDGQPVTGPFLEN